MSAPIRTHVRLWAMLAALAVVGLGILDQNRPWKHWQLEYFEHLEAAWSSRLDELRASTTEDLEFYGGEVRVARDGLQSRRAEIEELEQRAFELGRRLREAETRRARATDEAARRESRLEAESLREMRDGQVSRLDELHADLRRAEEALAAVRQPADELAERLRRLRRDSFLRSVPVLRLWAPSVAVRSTGLRSTGLPSKGLASSPQRCVTCHLGMDPELGDAAVAERTERAVFAPHPRPELYGPAATEGHGSLVCTDCHRGDGRSTDFARAGHGSPPASGAADSILAGVWVESTCESCHARDLPALDRPRSAEPVTAAAPVARAGRLWVDRLGCRACHAVGGAALASGGAKPGPSLLRVARKLDRGWVERFLADPENGHGGERMPSFWTDGEGGSDERRRAEIHAVVESLWQSSGNAEDFESRPGWTSDLAENADAVRGRDLFQGLGCAACHGAGPGAGPETAGEPSFAGPVTGGRTSAKVSADWLFRWLRKPSAWRADTPMPDFRLSADEAADLTAYLLDDPAGPQTSVAQKTETEPAATIIDELAREILEASTTLEDAQARLDAMDPRQRLLFVGRETILRHGCHGCHDVPGLEGEPAPDGGDLRAVGLALASRAAGRTEGLDPLDVDPLADHPGRWRLGDEARRALAVQLLSWRGQTSESSPGADLMHRHGCFTCHRPDGEPLIDAPSLHGVGGKIRLGRLAAYLEDPGADPPVRPWLERRMPTFALDPMELDLLLRFLVDRADAPLLEPAETVSAEVERLERTVGRAAFEVLHCGRCHWNAPDVGLQATAPAPDYLAVADRLRPSWIESWILDPARHDPAGDLPPPFPQVDGVHDTSVLRAALDAPMFELQRIRIEQVFESDEEQRAYLDDAPRVARALRRYLQDP